MSAEDQLSKVRDVVQAWRRGEYSQGMSPMHDIDAISAPEGEAAETEEAVAEVVSVFGDPEAFGEREIKVLADLRKIPYNTKLYAAPPPPKASAQALTGDDIDDVWAGCSEANDTIDMHEYAEAIVRKFCEKNAIPAPAQEGAA